MAQANAVRQEILRRHPNEKLKLIELKTSGDDLGPAPSPRDAHRGFFVKEIEEALIAGKIDAAIHSMKDIPTDGPDELVLTSVTRREDHRDCLISSGGKLSSLPRGSRIGTTSVRRAAQLLRAKPHFNITPVGGNVDTRLRKLSQGDCDALILAAAGLLRLGLQQKITEYLPLRTFLPAPGQGALAIQIRRDDSRTASVFQAIDDRNTRVAVEAERSFLKAIGGGCEIPVGAFGSVEKGRLHLRAMILSPDGKTAIKDELHGDPGDGPSLGEALAKRLLEAGGKHLVDEPKNSPTQQGRN
jgi:hydroxymethylbilane synthase